MLYVLEPVPVAPVFTLEESLYWVAYRQYAASWHLLTGEGHKHEIVDGLFEMPRSNYAFVTNECGEEMALEKLGLSLPEHPEDDYEEYASMSTEEALKKMEESKERYDRYWKEHEAITSYALSPFKSELFLKLRNGDIPAFGQLVGITKKEATFSDWRSDEVWEEVEYESNGIYMPDLDEIINGKEINGFQTIPPEFWDFEGVYWHENSARSCLGWCQWIFLRSDTLFQHFPHPVGKPITVEEKAGFLIYDDEVEEAEVIKQNTSRRGRTPFYDWQAFNVEVAMIANSPDGLPERQSDLKNIMLDWFAARDKFPAESLVKKHLKPYYDAIAATKLAS